MRDIRDNLMTLHPELVVGRLFSITELREAIGNPKYKSLADAHARRINRHFQKRKNVNRKPEFFSNNSVIIITNSASPKYNSLIEKLRRIIASNR